MIIEKMKNLIRKSDLYKKFNKRCVNKINLLNNL